jgi:hypothetical protein
MKDWLFTKDYVTSIQTLSNDYKKGLFPKRDHKTYKYEKEKILEYAKKHLTNVKEQTESTVSQLQIDRLKADIANKKAQTARNNLKLEAEKGLLIEKAKFDEALGARTAFFKEQLEFWGQRMADLTISIVDGDTERRDNFIILWRDESLKWLDAWSKDREFVVEYDLEVITPGLLTTRGRGRPKKLKEEKGPEKKPSKAKAATKKKPTGKGKK